jgi:hypothetical protein
MADNRPEESGPAPDSDRPKRPPPTIDLEATEVSSETPKGGGEAQPEPAPEPTPETASAEPVSEPPSRPISPPISPWVIAPFSGAVGAALVIGVGWLLGWPAVQPASSSAPQLNAAAIDDLTARIAGLESKIGKPTLALDPAAAARMDAVEKSLAALRGELVTTRAQGEKLASGLNEAKAAPRDGATPPDLSAVNARIAAVESAIRAQNAEIAQQGRKIADAGAADAKPADDVPLRRLVAAILLDVSVRIGEPFSAALEAAKSLAPNPDALKPLDDFAAKGVPSAVKLSSELLTLVPKLSPAAQQENATSGSGIVERLQAGAAKLVRIERTDTAGNDRGAVVARVTAAALHNDVAAARRELNTLAPADRAVAQNWLEKADARDAALAASRHFATEAMAALAKPAP